MCVKDWLLKGFSELCLGYPIRSEIYFYYAPLLGTCWGQALTKMVIMKRAYKSWCHCCAKGLQLWLYVEPDWVSICTSIYFTILICIYSGVESQPHGFLENYSHFKKNPYKISYRERPNFKLVFHYCKYGQSKHCCL